MSCLLPVDWSGWLARLAPTHELLQWGGVAVSSFGLIVAAEMGDKSQLVCMTLAARHHRALPIVAGAAVAFALLNLAAVVFGVVVARWVPEVVVNVAVALLFLIFGLRALFTREEEGGKIKIMPGHGLFLTTLLLIFVAEFGDKTQLTVAGMSAALPPVPVWLGGTLALVVTSAVGAWAGKALFRRMPLHLLHRLSGVLFLGFAVFAAWRLLPEALLAVWWQRIAFLMTQLWTQ